MVALDFNPPARAVRGFARLWFPLFVIVLGSVLKWRFDLPEAATAVWAVGAVLVALALVSAAIARVIFVALTVATYPIALVTSAIVLAFMYFFVMTPLGLWLRWRGHDPLRLRARGEASHWHPYAQDDDPRRAVRQF